MWPWSKREEGSTDNALASRRRAERIQSAVLACDFGPIHDVSRSGVRLRVPCRPPLAIGQEIQLELSAPTDGISLRAKVVRIQPIGGGRYDIGAEFQELSSEDSAAVENLARYGKRRVPGAFANEDKREKLIAALKLPDYYALLGLNSGAHIDEVHAAYRTLARKFHPDVCREPNAHQRFCMINDAHATLSDPARRKEYDQLYALRQAA
ncbi:MAG TPA: DnaJ domain-containing protein [Phycisphaerales bacterium]|jgi:hypothetical protein|nr:DnaJ domain-containing protein [Phycisphaerales bacterium]